MGLSFRGWKFVADMSPIIIIINEYAPKLEYDSTVWTSITSTDTKKLARIQRKSVALCQYRVFTYDHVTCIYEGFLTFLKLLTLHNRRRFLDTLFLFLFVQV
jgi:hypothetical protein